MTTKNSKCPKCGSDMHEGVIVDRGNFDVAQQAEWNPGAPVSSFFTGLKVKDEIPISTFRCTKCGYLESYACEQ